MISGPDDSSGLVVQRQALTPARVCVAVLIGLAGCVIIWAATPYNNFILRLGFISDSYLPVAALAVMLVVVLAANPLLRRLRPARGLEGGLNTRQLALVLGMMLVASVLPSQGLLRSLPYSLADTCVRRNSEKRLAEAHRQADLPESLFPDELRAGQRAPVSERMLGRLLPGESIPWGAWVPPLVSWGVFLLFFWVMAVGLSLVVLPQWRRNERLSFPHLEIQKPLIETPEEGRLLAPIFRNRGFWVGVAVVFGLYLLVGGNAYYPENVPAISLQWNLQNCFTEEPLVYLPWWIKTGRIYFIFLAVAFFMPGRVGFSIWFFAIGYALYMLVGRAYLPPFHWGTVSDHRSGAMLALTAGILWLGRARWAQIARSMLRSAETPEERRDRKVGWTFLAGAVGMFAWFVWAGVQPLWALLFVAIGFMVCLLITRLVVETGIPFIRIFDCQPDKFMSILPGSWVGPGTAFFGGVVWLFFQWGSRVSATPMAIHAVALDDEAGPRQQSRTGVLLLAVLVVGLVVCGAVHLYASYNHASTLDGRESPISAGGSRSLRAANLLLLYQQEGQIPRPVYNRPAHVVFGVVLAAALYWACLTFPRWPLHPIGLLMVFTFYGNTAWFSIFLGWLIKVLVLRYGGSRAYRMAKPFFIGLIVGEVFAGVFWSVAAAALVALGRQYKPVLIQPL